MNFKTFYNSCKFELLHVGRGNWDYYLKEYNGRVCGVVALAKPGTGAADCHFGDLKYFNKKMMAGEL
jgi:hypothetical protein